MSSRNPSESWLAIVIAMSVSFGLVGCRGEERADQATPTVQDDVLMEGRITSVHGQVVTLDDAAGSAAIPPHLVVNLTPDSMIRRAVGSAPSISIVAGGDVPLRIGDVISAYGPRQADGSIRAENVDANLFIGRDGIVTAVGPNYFDVRLRKDKMSTEFLPASSRVWVPTRAEIETFNLNVVCGVLSSPTDLKIGDDASFQGLFADDGSMVALCLWGPNR